MEKLDGFTEKKLRPPDSLLPRGPYACIVGFLLAFGKRVDQASDNAQ
jgi:hypothetical protein